MDILVTHCAPFGIMDEYKNTQTGCKRILEKVKELKPRYHIFGHCRECYGSEEREDTVFVNCCRFNAKFKAENLPFIFEFESK